MVKSREGYYALLVILDFFLIAGKVIPFCSMMVLSFSPPLSIFRNYQLAFPSFGVHDIVREAPFGQFVRYVSQNKYFQYPEEKPGFVLPTAYTDSLGAGNDSSEPNGSFKAEMEQDGVKSKAPMNGAKPMLVYWYSPDDPENPLNWSHFKRFIVATLIFLYTFAVYGGSSIYLTSEPGVVKEFGVSLQESLLPLSIYVIGCW